jgi:ubiquinone/menaquinone biosynthesis C-methylase UbiE
MNIAGLVDERSSGQTELVPRLELGRCFEEASRARSNNVRFIEHNAVKLQVEDKSVGVADLSLLLRHFCHLD